jgi:hypothetical protein
MENMEHKGMLINLSISAIMAPMTKKPIPKDTTLIQVILSSKHLTMLDDLRRRDPNLPNRSEMIREMIERSHKASIKR